MERRSTVVLLVVFGTGAFLAGLELMITAVALPSIVVDLADWTHLRAASWIINGYLLAYVVMMPLAGRLADLWGTSRLFLAALAVFTIGSALAGRAQSFEELVAARVVQAVGGGILVPVATASASHLFGGSGRARALGIIGGLTFLGMAAGPFAGAAILDLFHPADALARAGVEDGPLVDAFGAAWRYVFYLNVPIGLVAILLAWAAATGWETPRRRGRVDVVGAGVFSLALAALLVGLTLIGDGGDLVGGIAAGSASTALLIGAALLGTLAVILGVRRHDPFLDPRLFRSGAFSSATLVSLLTGYGFATAIVGGAVFVDRVLYGGADTQRVALGALAAATAVGAVASGFAIRLAGVRLVTLAGLAAGTVALVRMAAWTPATSIGEVAGWLALYGLGFGLTVTPRTTAAVEALGRRGFGVASATVTVARMIGMAIGLAVLTAYGSTTIDRLSAQVYASPDAYKAYIPAELRDRALRDGLVVEALERWAAGEAARIMVGIFLVAAAVTLVAVVPALAMGRRPRMLTGGSADQDGPAPDDGGRPTGVAADDGGPSLAL